jgi:hypothetical protein
MDGTCSNKNTDDDQTKDEDRIQTSIDTQKKDVSEKEDSVLPVDKQNNSTISPNDHQESENKNMSSDDCPLVDAKTDNAKESGDPPLLDKSASNDTKGLLSSMKSQYSTKNIVNEFCLLASQEVVAGSNTVANNIKLEKDEPSAEVPSKDKGELDKTEDANKQNSLGQRSQTLENGKIEGMLFIRFHLSYCF